MVSIIVVIVTIVIVIVGRVDVPLRSCTVGVASVVVVGVLARGF